VAINIYTVPSLRQPLFPEEEWRTLGYKSYGGKRYERRLSEVDSDGRLYADCFNCKNACFLDIDEFAPMDALTNSRRRPEFFAMLQAYAVAYDRGDLDEARMARRRIEQLRHKKCPSCQNTSGKLSPGEIACKEEYERMRKEACVKSDGCANPYCIERGDQACCVLQADHMHTIRESNNKKRKKYSLSDYRKWCCNGGVSAMRAEEAKGVQWLCGFCHCLEKTGKQANRCKDPSTMPDGKGKGTPEERKQYQAKWHAVAVYPKQQYVDDRKRSIGCCKGCGRSDVEGQEWCFHFDHRIESTKMKGPTTLALKGGGVCGLVRNHAGVARLEAPGFRELLDAEMDKCDLLCANCHHRKTNKYPARFGKQRG
jgi:hypothetical protein